MANCLRLTCLLVLFGIVSVKASSSDLLEPLEPILCPNDDHLRHTCYELVHENRSCTVITFDTCNDVQHGHHSHNHGRHWWVQSLCLNVQQENCTVYKCHKSCCDGWTTDSDGRCDKPVGDNDIACENGLVNWDDDKPKCECWSNFYGERCEIPRCEGGCKNGGTCRERLDGNHQCHCPPPFTGPNCETVTCLEPCENGGSCVSNGAEATCSCPLNYYGKTCAHRIDGSLCPMPNNTDCRRWNCRDECINTYGCRDGYVCCSDGCKMRCVRPVTKTCQLGDKFYRAGEMFSKDACNHCTCHANGTIACSKIECPALDCMEGEVIHEDDMCCPVCRRTGQLPIEHERPTLSRCYQGVVVPLNLSKNSNTYYLNSLNIEAWDYTGSKLQVTYSPSSLTHCGCDRSDRRSKLISVSAVDRYGSRTECNFWAYLSDPVSPTFLSCPVEIDAYEDEIIQWDEPRVLDNVGIQYMWSNIDRGDTLDAGDHTVTYTAVDYDGNQATCEFNVFIYGNGATGSQMPAGLRCRKRKSHVAGLVAGIVCGAVALVVLVTVAVLAMRVRRRRCTRQRHQHQRGLAVSNEHYGVGLFPDYKGSSTKPPGYTPPNNPPAYDEVNNPGDQDYKFANPPLYDELSLAGRDKTETADGDDVAVGNGVHEDAGCMEIPSDAVNNPTYGSDIVDGIQAPRQSDV